MKVILMMVITADGKIAKSSDHFPDWSSKEDKKMFRQVSKECGVIIMGDKTFFTLPSPLPGRLNVVFTLEDNPKPQEGVKWVSGDPKKVLEELEGMGYEKVLVGGGTGVNTMFLENDLIDEIYINVEPKIFGAGLGLFNGDFNVNLELMSMEKINNNTVSLKYKVLSS
ncbi:MAG: dihydrofolate reductase family protein [Patescibacteria group bacterium]|jgi:dihydrofolate reductase